MGHHDLRIVESFGDNSTSVLSREGTATVQLHTVVLFWRGKNSESGTRIYIDLETNSRNCLLDFTEYDAKKKTTSLLRRYFNDYLIFRSLCPNIATTTGGN